MELELKHLAPYLPYRLNFLEVRKGRFINDDDTEEQIELHAGMVGGLLKCKAYRVKSRKIILKPLSDLTKLIEKGKGHLATYVRNVDYYENTPFALPYLEFEWLLSQHYDVFKLIPNGLAVDINTIN